MEPRTHTARVMTDYTGVLRRQWLILVLSLLLGVGVAIGLLAALPKTYQSSASVLVTGTLVTTASTSSRSTADVNLDTEAQVVKSLPVAQAVKQQLTTTLTPAQLSSRVGITVPSNTSVLRITFAWSDAEGARLGAEAYANAYLDYRSTQAQTQITSRLQVLDKKAARTSGSLSTVNQRLFGVNLSPADRQDLKQTQSALSRRLAALAARRLPLETAPTTAGTVIDDAAAPKQATSPDPMLIVGSSILLLLLVGLGLAWAQDHRRGRIRRVSDLSTQFGVELLGTLREERPGRGAAPHPTHQYQQIVHAIVARLGTADQSLLVAGVGSSALAEQTAPSLGSELARTGASVLLVSSLEETVAPDGYPDGLAHRSLERAGLITQDSVRTGDLAGYVGQAEDEFGVVMVSTPPMGSSAHSQGVAPFVHLTVLVVEIDRSTHAEVDEALSQLQRVGVTTVAAVAVSGRRSRGGHPAAPGGGGPSVPEGTGAATAPGTGTLETRPAVREDNLSGAARRQGPRPGTKRLA